MEWQHLKFALDFVLACALAVYAAIRRYRYCERLSRSLSSAIFQAAFTGFVALFSIWSGIHNWPTLNVQAKCLGPVLIAVILMLSVWGFEDVTFFRKQAHKKQNSAP